MPNYRLLIQNKPKTPSYWQNDSAASVDEIEHRFVDQRKALVAVVSTERVRKKLKFPRRDKAQFFSEMSDAVATETPVVETLNDFSDSLGSKSAQFICKRLRDQMIGGMGLVDAMRDMPTAFDQSEIGMLEAFNKTGKLADGLRRCYDVLTRSDRVIRAIKKAVTYPCIVATLGVGFVIYIGKGPLPVLRGQYTTVKPPALFKFTCDVVDLTLNNYTFMVTAAVLGIPTLIFLVRRALRSTLCHRLFLKLPKIGKLVKTYVNANFLRTYHALTESELPEPEKMRMCRGLSGLRPYQEAFAWGQIDTNNGKKPHEVLAEYEPLFGKRMIGVFRRGSERGQMAPALASFLIPVERDLDDAVDSFKELATPITLLLILPPILTLVIGLFTGIFGLMNVY